MKKTKKYKFNTKVGFLLILFLTSITVFPYIVSASFEEETFSMFGTGTRNGNTNFKYTTGLDLTDYSTTNNDIFGSLYTSNDDVITQTRIDDNRIYHILAQNVSHSHGDMADLGYKLNNFPAQYIGVSNKNLAEIFIISAEDYDDTFFQFDIDNEGNIYVGGHKRNYKFNSLGEQVWNTTNQLINITAVSYHDGYVYMGGYPDGIFKLDASTGNIIDSSPSYNDQSVIYIRTYDEGVFYTGDEYIRMLDHDLEIQWTNPNLDGEIGDIRYYNDVIVTRAHNRLYALNLNGGIEWSKSFSSHSFVSGVSNFKYLVIDKENENVIIDRYYGSTSTDYGRRIDSHDLYTGDTENIYENYEAPAGGRRGTSFYAGVYYYEPEFELPVLQENPDNPFRDKWIVKEEDFGLLSGFNINNHIIGYDELDIHIETLLYNETFELRPSYNMKEFGEVGDNLYIQMVELLGETWENSFNIEMNNQSGWAEVTFDFRNTATGQSLTREMDILSLEEGYESPYNQIIENPDNPFPSEIIVSEEDFGVSQNLGFRNHIIGYEEVQLDISVEGYETFSFAFRPEHYDTFSLDLENIQLEFIEQYYEGDEWEFQLQYMISDYNKLIDIDVYLIRSDEQVDKELKIYSLDEEGEAPVTPIDPPSDELPDNLLGIFIGYFTGIFPDSEDITTSTSLAYVLVTLLLVWIGTFLMLMRTIHEFSPIPILGVLTFIVISFFTSIGYISPLILTLLIIVAITLFVGKVRQVVQTGGGT